VIIHTVEYAGTVVKANGEIPGDLPQVAFSGRSNVGKSSLINTLLQRTRSKVARVSGTPGKTQALNFYRVNDRFFLLDLPGFGYAKVPKSMRDSWKGRIEGYLARTVDLRGVVHLVDARHDPTPQDFEMLEFLSTLGMPTLVVLTKVDKLKRHQRTPTFARAAEQLGLDPDQVLPFSSQTGEGRELLLEALEELLSDAPAPASVDGEGDPDTAAPGLDPPDEPVVGAVES
jgi:GTP-binding protein